MRFLAPLRDTQARLAELRLQQREGLGDLLDLSNAIEAVDGELQPFVKRYALDGPDGTGPLPLGCAFEIVESSLARRPLVRQTRSATWRARMRCCCLARPSTGIPRRRRWPISRCCRARPFRVEADAAQFA
jgi:hypothetical protein